MEVKHQYRLRAKFKHKEKAQLRLGFYQRIKPNSETDKRRTKARQISFVAIRNRRHFVSKESNRHDKTQNTVVKVRLEEIL